MFVNALMLVGVAAAVLPLVLHLLSRARFRTVEWGGMMFLEGTEGLQRRSSRLHQWVLLAVRAAMVAALAVALARPVARGRYATPAAGQRVVAVLLLDCSASMGFEENGHARMTLARAAAKQVLGIHKGDRAALVLMGREQAAAERAPTGDLWDVGRRVDAAAPGAGRADVARGLDDALTALEAAASPASPAADRPFVRFYVVTDRQASNWRDVDGAFAAAWRQRLDRAGAGGGRVFVIPVGGIEAANVAVESVELLNGPAVVGQPAEVEVRVRNYGPVQWAALPLTVTTTGADRNRLLDVRMNLLPDATAVYRATATYEQAGTHVVSAELNRPPAGATPAGGAAVAAPRAGGFNLDDRADAVIPVIEPIKVLVISSDERPPGEADYLQLALAPFRSAKRKGADPSTVDVAPADGWAGPTVALPARPDEPAGRDARLAAYQVVVLANVERFTPAQAAAVEQFVYDGGGLLVAPGNLARPRAYDDALFRAGAGVLPAALAEPTPADGSGETTVAAFDPAHPVFRFLRGRPDAARAAVVRRYFPVETPLPAATRAVAQFANGAPFLLESRAGRGRVLLIATPLDADWTTLPLTNVYLPFVQSAIRYLADTSTRRVNLQLGEVIELPFEDALPNRSVRVTTPDGQDRAAEVARAGDASVARFADTDVPGVYAVRVAEPGRKPYMVHFVVRGPRGESDLTPLTSDRWAWLEQALGAQRVDPAERPLAASLAASSDSRELWAYALGGVLLLAMLELALARRWSRADASDDDVDPGTRRGTDR